MNFTDEIRNYQVTSALPTEKNKTYREYLTLAILKYSFPEKIANIIKGEAPDLQDIKDSIGVEATSGFSPRDEQITGESLKYSLAKTERERQKCLRVIKNCGGTRDEISTGYPLLTADSDKSNVIVDFQKKLKKVRHYRKQFNHMGLAIIIDIPLFFFGDSEWGKWLENDNKGQYDFVALIHWLGVDIYDFVSPKYKIKRIVREDMDAIKKMARMAAEGILNEENPI